MTKVGVYWGPAPDERSVKLYDVYNTAHRSLLVLASDRLKAIEIAYAANHIHSIWNRKDKNYPHADEVRNLSSDCRLADSADSIRSAIAQRLQGTVHLESGRMFVGYELVRTSAE
jgi:hypothetical protein